jgi:hypothetical protein
LLDEAGRAMLQSTIWRPIVNPIDPISAFGGKTISDTYDNGWSFTNTFDGHLRTSQVPRGLFQQHVEMDQLRDGLFFASWVDDEMGLLAQIIDFETETVFAAIPVDDQRGTEILVGRLTDPGSSFLAGPDPMVINTNRRDSS